MTASLRDQRVGLYSYSSTNTNGLITTAYTHSCDAWARIQPPTGRELDTAQKANYRVDAVITLLIDMHVDPEGVIVDRATSTIYKVQAVLARRQLREQVVLALSTTDSQDAFNVVD